MRLVDEARDSLAEAGFFVVDELDLGPWRGPGSSTFEEGTLRWTVADGDGRRGFVALTVDTPREVARPEDAPSPLLDYLAFARGSYEGVEGTSLVSLPATPAEAVRFRRLLEAGAEPRPFVSSAEVTSLYERLGDARLDTASVVIGAGGDPPLVGALYRPETAEPRDHSRVLDLLRHFDDGVPVEWALRRLSSGTA